MFVKAMHPNAPHQLWEVAAGHTLRYGVLTAPVGEDDKTDPNWSWTPLLEAHGIPAGEVWVHGDPTIYRETSAGRLTQEQLTKVTASGSALLPSANTASSGVLMEATARYWIRFATWWDPAKKVDVTVITGEDGDIYLLADNGRTIDKAS